MYKYREIPKIIPRAYLSKALFEGLSFGGALVFEEAYIRREIRVSKSSRLILRGICASQKKNNLPLGVH